MYSASTAAQSQSSGHTLNVPGQYNCQHCEKSFQFAYQLQYHTTLLHGRTNLVHCTLCGKAFVAQFLPQHLKTHITGKKTFSCKTCRKVFARSFSLTEHTRIHTGEKPYACILCSKRYRHSSALLRHKRTHSISANSGNAINQLDATLPSNVAPHKCLKCCKCFMSACDWETHTSKCIWGSDIEVVGNFQPAFSQKVSRNHSIYSTTTCNKLKFLVM